MSSLQRKLEEANRRDFALYVAELRKAERRQREAPDPDEDFMSVAGAFRRSDASYPLGPRMPLGPSLRADGESHREAWAAIVRGDPCAYCGRLAAGTVDHIEPQHGARARGDRDLHTWLNYTAACASCNGSKGNERLLFFLLRRAPKAKRPAAPARSVGRLSEDARRILAFARGGKVNLASIDFAR